MRMPPVSLNDLFDLRMLRAELWPNFAKLFWKLFNYPFV